MVMSMALTLSPLDEACFSIPDRSRHLLGDAGGHACRGVRLLAAVDAGWHPDQFGEPGAEGDPRRRFAQHVRTARLWLPDELPWWLRSPKHRPLYEWIRALYRDDARLPFMWVAEWVEPGGDPRVAERAAIVRLLAEGAALLNFEACTRGPQLPLL